MISNLVWVGGDQKQISGNLHLYTHVTGVSMRYALNCADRTDVDVRVI